MPKIPCPLEGNMYNDFQACFLLQNSPISISFLERKADGNEVIQPLILHCTCHTQERITHVRSAVEPVSLLDTGC